MNVQLFFYLMVVSNIWQINCFEPISTGLAVVTAVFASAVLDNALKSLMFESCDNNWIDPRLDGESLCRV